MQGQWPGSTDRDPDAASTATFLPILAAVAVGLSLNPMVMTIPVALGASMAFMMPVATPPNAIVFSYEGMKLADMVRAGFMLNILAIAVAFGWFVALGPIVFGFKIWTAPACIRKTWRRHNSGGPKKAAAKQAASDAKSGNSVVGFVRFSAFADATIWHVQRRSGATGRTAAPGLQDERQDRAVPVAVGTPVKRRAAATPVWQRVRRLSP